MLNLQRSPFEWEKKRAIQRPNWWTKLELQQPS
jgi:hypothetical protein